MRRIKTKGQHPFIFICISLEASNVFIGNPNAFIFPTGEEEEEKKMSGSSNDSDRVASVTIGYLVRSQSVGSSAFSFFFLSAVCLQRALRTVELMLYMKRGY